MAKKRKMPPRYKSGPKKGRFMSKRAVAARRAAPKRAPKRRKARRNPFGFYPAGATTKLKSATGGRSKRKRRAYAKGMKSVAAAKGRAFGVKAKRRAAARKAAATRAAKKAKRSLAAKKAARTRARHLKGAATVAKKRRKSKKSKSTKRRGRRLTHAQAVALGRKGGKAAARKRRRRAKSARPGKARRRRARRVVVSPRRKRTVYYRTKKRGKLRRATLRVRRVKRKGARSYGRLTVSRNPLSAMKGMLKSGLMLYGGILGMRVVNNLLKQYVVPKLGTSLPAKLVPVLPALGGFVLAAFAPKLLPGKTALVNGLQAGAVVALGDALVNTFIRPSLPANVQGLLAGVDDGYGAYGRFGYGYGEYLNPPAQRSIGMGTDVSEAMALDEYVQQPGGLSGFDVQEALSDNEVQGFQSGFAAGSLSKTVFSS